MLLTVSEVEGFSDGMDELSDEELLNAVANSTTTGCKQLPAHPSVVMVSSQAFLGHLRHWDAHALCVCGKHWFLSVNTTPSILL